jgi:hypothetical protein
MQMISVEPIINTFVKTINGTFPSDFHFTGISAIFAYINFRFIKYGDNRLMALSLFFSILILLSGQLLSPFKNIVAEMLVSIDFSELLL